MTTIHIPAAALEAGARALADAYYRNCSDGRLTLADTDDTPEDWYVEARAAFEAMVGAWEGMERYTFPESGSGDDYTPALDEIILPLAPQEKPDGK